MAEVETAFMGQTAQAFADHAETVRGHIRYEMVRRNLGAIIGGETLQVADIGGGSGIDALWLARQGHSVLVVEPADDQLALAEANIGAAESDVRNLITLRKSTSDELLADGGEGQYDLVLSHGVAMYLAEPAPYIDSLVMLTRPAGHVSLLEKGYWGAYTTMVREEKYADARQLAETRHFINHMHKDAWVFLPQELVDILRIAGAKHADWSGIRVLHDSDYRLTSTVDQIELQHILEEETQAGWHTHTRGLGQMIHVIAQRDKS